MKRFKRFVLMFLFFIIIAALLSVLIVRRTTNSVTKGFAFGAPTAQTRVTTDGTYTVNYYGYPSTYRVQETFKPAGDVFNESTYEAVPFNFFYVASNFIFWLALFMALLAPITIFYRPKKKVVDSTPEVAKTESQVESTETETLSQIKSDTSP